MSMRVILSKDRTCLEITVLLAMIAGTILVFMFVASGCTTAQPTRPDCPACPDPPVPPVYDIEIRINDEVFRHRIDESRTFEFTVPPDTVFVAERDTVFVHERDTVFVTERDTVLVPDTRPPDRYDIALRINDEVFSRVVARDTLFRFVVPPDTIERVIHVPGPATDTLVTDRASITWQGLTHYYQQTDVSPTFFDEICEADMPYVVICHSGVTTLAYLDSPPALISPQAILTGEERTADRVRLTEHEIIDRLVPVDPETVVIRPDEAVIEPRDEQEAIQREVDQLLRERQVLSTMFQRVENGATFIPVGWHTRYTKVDGRYARHGASGFLVEFDPQTAVQVVRD